MSETPAATILVVDDLPANRDLMSRRLERSGFRVLTAGSGAEALDAVRQSNVDMVLLDIMMPGMTGFDVLRTLRATRPASALPVLMVTARTDSEDVVEALAMGANDYITKPVDFPVALERIKKELRMTQALRTEAAPAIEPKTPAQAVPGSVLGGRYRLDSVVGGGSFGTVFRARHLELNREVAVKILSTSAGIDPESFARFKREGDLACRVRHPNAVSVYDLAVTPNGVVYLVMELAVGETPRQRFNRGPMDLREALGTFTPLARGLEHAHAAGVFHRDIKPSNIILCDDGTVRLVDFGIAAAHNAEPLTNTGQLGTLAYLPPEAFKAERADPPSVDVYAFGLLLHESLTGQRSFPVDPSLTPAAAATEDWMR